MKKTRVFIDGKEGTTGLKIHDRLKYIKDIELISLNEADRKNINKRNTTSIRGVISNASSPFPRLFVLSIFIISPIFWSSLSTLY